MKTSPDLDYKLRLLSTKMAVLSGEYQKDAIETAGNGKACVTNEQLLAMSQSVVFSASLSHLCHKLSRAFQETADHKLPE